MEIDKDKVVDVVNLVFHKLLGKVLHGRLIQKIKMHRVLGDTVVWIQIWVIHNR